MENVKVSCAGRPKLSSKTQILCPVKVADRLKIEPKLNYNVPAFKIIDSKNNFYECFHCQTNFYSDDTMKDHLGSFHSDSFFFCVYCGEFLRSSLLLKRHLIPFSYNCDKCDYSTNHYTQFRRHTERLHKIKLKAKFEKSTSRDKVYECQYCGYRSFHQYTYQNHMRSFHELEIEGVIVVD